MNVLKRIKSKNNVVCSTGITREDMRTERIERDQMLTNIVSLF